MKYIMDLDVPVGRRTVLSILWDGDARLLRQEKTARALLAWMDREEIREVQVWSDGEAWKLTRDKTAIEPEWSQRQGALIHTIAK